MHAFMPLLIGITAALGFTVCGLGLFVLGAAPPRPLRRR